MENINPAVSVSLYVRHRARGGERVILCKSHKMKR